MVIGSLIKEIGFFVLSSVVKFGCKIVVVMVVVM